MDAGGFEFLWECEGVVVGGVWAFGEAEGACDDDGGVCGFEEVDGEVGVSCADDDGFEVAFLGPVDGVGDLVEGVGVHEDWVLVFTWEDGGDGFHALVGCGVGLLVGGCLVEEGVEGFGVVVVEGDDEPGVLYEGEVFVGPAVGGDDGGASWDGAAAGEDSGGEDAVGSGGGDDDRVWVDGDEGADLWGDVAEFVGVSGRADGGGFFESEFGDGVDESWVDVFAGEVDDL